jgi:hypothetical protein
MGRGRGGTHVCLYPKRSQAYDFQALSYKPMLEKDTVIGTSMNDVCRE